MKWRLTKTHDLHLRLVSASCRGNDGFARDDGRVCRVVLGFNRKSSAAQSLCRKRLIHGMRTRFMVRSSAVFLLVGVDAKDCRVFA